MKAETLTATVAVAGLLSVSVLAYQGLRIINPQRSISDSFDVQVLPDGNLEYFVQRRRAGVVVTCYYIRQPIRNGGKVLASNCQQREILFEHDLVGRIGNVFRPSRSSDKPEQE